MQVSIAPAPENGLHFKCHSCDDKIEKSHVVATRDRKEWHFCEAKCYGDWRKSKKEAA